MSAKTRGTALAAVLVTGLMLLGGACGGSSDKSSDTSAKSGDSSSASTVKSGGDDSSCADLFNMSGELAMQFDAMTTAMSGSSGGVSADMNAMAATLDAFTSSVPDEIRNDWKTIVSGFTTYANALQGIDSADFTDPAMMEKLTAATATMDDAKFQEASTNLEAWTTKNCPSYALK